MPGKVPLYQEAERSAAQAAAAPTYAARPGGRRPRLHHRASCADLTDAVVAQLADATCCFRRHVVPRQ